VVLGAARIRRKGVDLAFPFVGVNCDKVYDDAFRLQGYVVGWAMALGVWWIAE
jgi:hypothetical protein